MTISWIGLLKINDWWLMQIIVFFQIPRWSRAKNTSNTASKKPPATWITLPWIYLHRTCRRRVAARFLCRLLLWTPFTHVGPTLRNNITAPCTFIMGVSGKTGLSSLPGSRRIQACEEKQPNHPEWGRGWRLVPLVRLPEKNRER